MIDVDWDSVYAQIPEVMGLPELQLRYGKWVGPYYMNGSEHPSRRDKMVVMRGRKGDGMVTVSEQGGETITLISWLIQYGRIEAKSVYRHLGNIEHREYVKVVDVYTGPARNVEWWQFGQGGGGSKSWKNPLYLLLSGIYGKERTDAAFLRYNVCDGLKEKRTGIIGTRFWYVNAHGEVLFDKTMFYNPDGHRNHDLHPMRQYKVRDGYSKLCLFGENALIQGRPVIVVESEKSAIIASLQFPDYNFVACGGLKCLSRLKMPQGYDIWLCPDRDGVEDWAKTGYKIWRWWEKCGKHVGPKSDIADVILAKYGK